MKKIIPGYLYAGFVICFIIIFKLPHLSLPHFWDEAWSYSPAVHYLYNHGLGMLPSAVPPELSKGHPLFFFFLFAGWMKIFGVSLVAKHSLALIIATGTLVMLFVVARRLFNETIAAMSVGFMTFQAVFLAQSSMMLPEMLLALLTLATFYFFIRGNLMGYMITGTLLVMTKETGIIFIVILLLFQFTRLFRSEGSETSLFRKITYLIIHSVPLLLFFLYLLIQKKTYGWYLYPEHINFITGVETGRNQLEMYMNQLFVLHGQFLLLFLLIIGLVFVSVKTREFVYRREPVFILISFMMSYLLFSSFNFFSPRYLLSITWILAVFCGYALFEATARRIAFSLAVGALITGGLWYFSYHVRYNGDYDLGYLHAVSLQQKAVQFCEENGWYDQAIYSNFLVHEALTKPTGGFLRNKPFSSVVTSLNNNPRYLVFNNIEPDPEYGKVSGNDTFELMKRFDESWMWVEIYQRRDQNLK